MSEIVKLDVVFVTKLDHLYTLNISIKRLMGFNNVNLIYIITQKQNFKFFNNFPNNVVKLIDEDSLLPNMTFSELKSLQIPFFPKSAGWYYQQFLKLGASFIDAISENYVVVDADTIFLTQPTFMDEKRRFLFVKAEEYHEPYFDNYKGILLEEPNREFSFISQYMVFNKKLVKEMCQRIEKNFNYIENWHWLIIKKLKGNDANLFSEYETYGHFIKNHYPERAVFVSLPWLRDGSKLFNSTFPTISQINALSQKYHFISIELKADTFLGKVKKVLFCKIYPKYKYLVNSLINTKNSLSV